MKTSFIVKGTTKKKKPHKGLLNEEVKNFAVRFVCKIELLVHLQGNENCSTFLHLVCADCIVCKNETEDFRHS